MATPQQDLRIKLLEIVDIAYEQYKRDLPRYQLIEDLMTKEVVTTNPAVSLDEAALIMGKKHIGSLIVIKYETPIAIVSERDLLSKVLAYGLFLKDQTVEEVMSYPLATISPTAKIKEAAKQMIVKRSRLAVFDAGKLVGIITASDLIKGLPDVSETEVPVDDFMTKDVVMADENTSVLDIARMMGSKRIGSVIITREGEPFGIFTERNLLTNFLAKDKALFSEVGPECSTPMVVIPSGVSAHRAAALMALKHMRRLPVVKDEKIVGIVTARDLVEAYAK